MNRRRFVLVALGGSVGALLPAKAHAHHKRNHGKSTTTTSTTSTTVASSPAAPRVVAADRHALAHWSIPGTTEVEAETVEVTL